MTRSAKRHRLKIPRAQQLTVLFWLLVGASTAWIVTGLLDLSRVVLRADSLRDLWVGDWSFGGVLPPFFYSKVFQVFILALGWSFWLGVRRRRLDQDRLRRSEQKYRDIINHAGEAIFLLDGAGRVREWNKAAENLFGEPRRNVLNRPFPEVHLCYGVEIERAMADARRLQRSLTFEFPFPRRGRPDGQISLTISSVTGGAATGPTGGKPGNRSGGKSGNSSAGKSDAAATDTAVPVDPDETFVVLARDITSEKQLETKMSETEKLAGIGQLAAGIAHQLNTPLGSILLSAQMLEGSLKGEDEKDDVWRIIRQTDQCRTIIKGLLNFARPSGSERGELNLDEVIRETVYLMEKNLKLAGVEVTITENCDPVVFGNRNELDQVFFNLLANALDAMPDGGRIDITLQDGAPGEVRVEFADTGEGVPEENRDRVFLPFFTTKVYGKGTGLGLSIVARIVHEHGGRIEMDSKPGGGTKFYLSLPRPGFGLGRPAVMAGKE